MRRDLARRSTAQVTFDLLDDHQVGVELGGGGGESLEIGVLAIAGVAQRQLKSTRRPAPRATPRPLSKPRSPSGLCA